MPNPQPGHRADASADRVPSTQSEPLFVDPRAGRAEQGSSSLVPPPLDQPRRALRSTSLWIIALLTVAAVIGVLYAMSHRRPSDDGRVRGPADEAAPNAPPDYKHR